MVINLGNSDVPRPRNRPNSRVLHQIRPWNARIGGIGDGQGAARPARSELGAASSQIRGKDLWVGGFFFFFGSRRAVERIPRDSPPLSLYRFLCEPTGRDGLLPESAQGQLDRCTFFSLILLSFPNLDFGGDIPLLLLNLPNFELNTIICVL